MKPLQFLRLPLASLFIFSLVGIAADEPDPGQIEISVGKLLEQGHYSRRKLDDKVSQELLKNYLDTLDYNHLFFTQQDVAAFTAKYGTTLDDDILLGNPEPAFQIYNLYKKRVEDRVAKVKDAAHPGVHVCQRPKHQDQPPESAVARRTRPRPTHSGGIGSKARCFRRS